MSSNFEVLCKTFDFIYYSSLFNGVLRSNMVDGGHKTNTPLLGFSCVINWDGVTE